METKTAGPKTVLDKTVVHVPHERSHFIQLLAKNPNHFGNLVASPFPPVQPMTGNSTYEKLHCVGLNPVLGLLEGTIEINLPTGYGGDICAAGSTEYVRFYVDYGAGWQDVGLAATPVHDIPNAADCAGASEKPLSYVVTLPYDGTKTWCGEPQLPAVRGILSWNSAPPPNQPGWLPVWGNVVDQHVQIAPIEINLGSILGLLETKKLAQLPDGIQAAAKLPVPLPDPPPVTIEELKSVYAVSPSGPGAAPGEGHVKTVPAHRFGFPDLHAALTGTKAPSQVAASIETWKALGLDWEKAIGSLQSLDGDVQFEQIECLGLDVLADKLAASFRVKRPYGYSGQECQAGSTEFVSFWADWDDTCNFQYLGTTQVQVHDFPTIPADGLEYTAVLPVDLSQWRIPCDSGPRVARVRAVISWATPPSTIDPNLVPFWGNIFDAHVQLRPLAPGVTTGLIDIVGGISTEYIDTSGNGMTLPNAVFALGGSPADPWGLQRACPFGGVVRFQATPKSGKYRIVTRPAGSAITPVPLTNAFWVQPAPGYGFGHYVTPDPDGWLDYLDIYHNEGLVLGEWSSSGDSLWEIRLEPQGAAPGDWLKIQLDNTAPRRKPAVSPYEPPEVTCDIQITSGGGDCADFGAGTSIAGSFVARDDHFGAFSMYTTPDTIGPNEPTTPVASTSETSTFAAGGSPWSLSLSGMKPCGYVVRLEVYDRSIVNSQPGSHNGDYADVGFCVS